MLRALDFGCGIGRISILLNEFNIESYGIDISENAIAEANALAQQQRYGADCIFQVYDGKNIPFEDNFFDFTISDCVMDSIPFDLAKLLMKEICRVTKRCFYVSLISEASRTLFGLNKIASDEIVVEEEHEKGTVQSFYTLDKIHRLIENTSFVIKWGELITNHNLLEPSREYGRYYIVLEKPM